MARTLQLRFEDDALKVSVDMGGDPELIGIITTCLKSAWKFVKFTESRFLTVGVSSRSIVVALLLGMDNFVAFIQADPTASKYYLNGFDRLKSEPDRKVFIAEGALVSRVPEGVLAEVLKDPRVGLRHDEIWEVLCTDMKWLVDLPGFIWQAVASVAKMDADEFRGSCVAKAHICFHFFWRRVLEPAGHLPWTLVRGDLLQNLEDLAKGSEPEDPVSSKLWQLSQRGFSKATLVKTLEVMQDIGWSTLVVEQQHGSMALLSRHHPEYTAGTLQARTLVTHVRKLLPHVSKAEKQLATVQRHLEKTLRRNPSKADGRAMFVSQLFAHL